MCSRPFCGTFSKLLLQLRQRFGRLTAAATARIDEAGTADLDAWLGRVLTASSLDDVLGAKVAGPPKKATRSTRMQPRDAGRRARG